MKEESGKALSLEYKVEFNEIENHIEDLLQRFGNELLGDTVARVGKDPVRKLSENDRLICAAKLALKHNIKPINLAAGIAAGLLFEKEDDPASKKIQNIIKIYGIEKVLKEVCNLNPYEELSILITEQYKLLRK